MSALSALDLVLIHQLLGEYGHCTDARDWDRFAELFTPDAVMDYTAVHAPSVFHGIDEILAYFHAANHPSAHHVTNIVAHRADHGTVTVHSKFLAPFTRSSHRVQRWYGGDYRDTVALVDGEWRFTGKVCVPRWQFAAQPWDDSALPELRRTF